jgi:hypothetical protein
MPTRTHLVLRDARHLGDRTERAAAPWEGGRAVPKQSAQGIVFYMRAAWHHRQSMLVRTGMSRRMTLLLTLCNSPLAGAAQVAAAMRAHLVDTGQDAGRPDLGIVCACGVGDQPPHAGVRGIQTAPAGVQAVSCRLFDQRRLADRPEWPEGRRALMRQDRAPPSRHGVTPGPHMRHLRPWTRSPAPRTPGIMCWSRRRRPQRAPPGREERRIRGDRAASGTRRPENHVSRVIACSP